MCSSINICINKINVLKKDVKSNFVMVARFVFKPFSQIYVVVAFICFVFFFRQDLNSMFIIQSVHYLKCF